MWKPIVVLIPLLFMIKGGASVEYKEIYDEENNRCIVLPDNSTRCCFKEGHICNSVLHCQCCNKQFFEDGSDGGLTYPNVGYYCKNDDARKNPGGRKVTRSGCCQRCTSEGDGCTSDQSPCCNFHDAVPDLTCPLGQTKCQRMQRRPDCSPGNYVSCGAENSICHSFFFCCVGLVCNKFEPEFPGLEDYGICKREKGYTGRLPPKKEEGFQKSGSMPLFESCSADGLTTTSASTTITPTTETPDEADCRAEGDYCDSGVCCENLQCPDNYCIIKIIRRILNYFGLWYRVCRNYPAIAQILFQY